MFVVECMEQDTGDQSKRVLTDACKRGLADIVEFAENPMIAFSQMSRTNVQKQELFSENKIMMYFTRIQEITPYENVLILPHMKSATPKKGFLI